MTSSLGGQIDVSYGHQNPCDAAYVSGRERWTSDKDCFAQWYSPSSGPAGFEWFHKYLVRRVGASDDALGYEATPDFPENGDQTSGSSRLGDWSITDYYYQGTPAWRFTNDRNLPDDHESWDDWRGYETTRVVRLKTDKRQIVTVPDGADADDRRDPVRLSVREITRYRGMNGSKKNPAGDVVSAKLDTIEHDPATEPADASWLASRTAETQVLEPLGAGTAEDGTRPISRTYQDYDTMVTATNTPALGPDARLSWESQRIEYTRLVGTGDDRKRTITTTVHDGGTDHRGVLAGAVTSVQDTSASTNIRPICTTSAWKGTASIWMRVLAATRTYQGGCGDADKQLKAEIENYYDGDNPPEGPLVPELIQGDLTQRRTTLTTTPAPGETGYAKERFEYDSLGRQTYHQNPRGARTTTTYTPSAGAIKPVEQVTTTNELGHTETTEFSLRRGQPSRVIDPNLQATILGYDQLGRLTTVRLPGNSGDQAPSMEYRYRIDAEADAPMRVQTITQRDHATTGTETTSTTDSMFEYYDGWGRPVESQVKTQYYDYDDEQLDWHVGRLVSVTGYDGAGQVRFAMPNTPNGSDPGTDLLNPDPDPVWWKSETTYDSADRPIKIVQAFNAKQGAALDTATTNIAYLGDRTRTFPPANKGVTDTLTNVRGQTSGVIRYAGDPTLLPDIPVRLRTGYTYRVTGQLDSISQQHGDGSTFADWDYAFDLGGRRIKATDPDTGVSIYAYDAASNLTSTTDAQGRTVNTTYDPLDRPTREADGNNNTLLTREWDTAPEYGKGREASVTAYTPNGAGGDWAITRTTTGYDRRGNPKAINWSYPNELAGVTGTATGSFTTSYTYNDVGAAKTVATSTVEDLPATTLSATYNTAGLLETLHDADGSRPIARSWYAADNRPWMIQSINPGTSGLETSRWMHWADTAPILESIGTSVSNVNTTPWPTRDLRYTRDKVNNVTQIYGDIEAATTGASKPNAMWCYQYDAINRLERARTSNVDADGSCGTSWANTTVTGANYDFDYTYDDVDRLTQVQVITPGIAAHDQTWTYAAGGKPHAPIEVPNSLTGTDTATVAFDNSGNVSTKTVTGTGGGTTNYDYTPHGRIRSITTANAVTRYAYAPDGLRAATHTTDTSTLSKTGTLTLGDITITAGHASLTLTHPETGRPLGVKTNTGWAWHDSDQQNNIRYDITTTEQQRINYYPEGATTNPIGQLPDTHRGYLNKQHDTTSDIRLDHRNYPSHHRLLLNPDPSNSQDLWTACSCDLLLTS